MFYSTSLQNVSLCLVTAHRRVRSLQRHLQSAIGQAQEAQNPACGSSHHPSAHRLPPQRCAGALHGATSDLMDHFKSQSDEYLFLQGSLINIQISPLEMNIYDALKAAFDLRLSCILCSAAELKCITIIVVRIKDDATVGMS